MKKVILLTACVLTAGCFLLLCGCRSSIDSTLPDDPVEFAEGRFVDPSDPQGIYASIEYKGRTYIGYGTAKRRLTGKDVDQCLGYMVPEEYGPRVFLLKDSPEADFLVSLSVLVSSEEIDARGIYFYRAVDTKGKEVRIPSCIGPDFGDFW